MLIKTKNCITYILENENDQEISVFVSAARSTKIKNTREGFFLSIGIASQKNVVQWYVEISIPGGTNLTKMAFEYEGDRTSNTFLQDFNEDTIWGNPLNIEELIFTVTDSSPKIYFRNSHTVGKLII